MPEDGPACMWTRGNKYLNIDQNNNRLEDISAIKVDGARIISTVAKACGDWFVQGFYWNCYNGKTLPYSVEVPSGKLEGVEALVFEANFVKLWIIKKDFLLILPVEYAVPANRHTCVDQVVGLIENKVVDSSSRKCTVKPKVEKRKDEEDILVEHVKDEKAVAAVGFTAMAK